MGLEDANVGNRLHVVQHGADPGVGNRGRQHVGRSVGQDRGLQTGRLQRGQHALDLGIGVELEVKVE